MRPCGSSPAPSALVTGRLARDRPCAWPASSPRAGRAAGACSRAPAEASRSWPASFPAPPEGEHVALVADVADAGCRSRAPSTASPSERAASTCSFANAGIAHYAPFADQSTSSAAEQMVEVNVLGTIYTVKAAPPADARPGPRPLVVVLARAPGSAPFPWGGRLRRHEGLRPGLRRGAPPRALGHGRLAHHRLPRRGRDRPARDHERERLPDWRASDGELPGRRAGAGDRPRESRATVAPSTCRRGVRLLGLNGVAPRAHRPPAGAGARRDRGAPPRLAPLGAGSRRRPRRSRRPSSPR